MKDTPNRFVRGATLLAIMLATTGSADAGSRIRGPNSTLVGHTVQDAIGCEPHSLQDCIPNWLWREPPDAGPLEGYPPGLALGLWSESIEALIPSGATLDPLVLVAALPAPELERALAISFDRSGGDSLVPTIVAQIPAPGALPVLGLGALALIGRRRRI